MLVDILKRMHSVTRAALWLSAAPPSDAVSQRPTEKQPAHISSTCVQVGRQRALLLCKLPVTSEISLLCMCYQDS